MILCILFLKRRRNQIILGVIVDHGLRQNLVRSRISGRVFQMGLHECRHLIHIEINVRYILCLNILNPVQTFLYAAIMSRQQSLKVAPSLLYIHRAASESYSPVIEMGEPRQPKIPVNNFAFFEDEFRERLQRLLKEIFDENEPFTQTEDTKKCAYCDFKAICKR